MTIQTNIQWELTDTFGGDANYCWVKRGTIETKPGEEFSDLAAIRRVKKEIGWNGLRCKVEYAGDLIVIHPQGLCQVCFITFHSFGSCSYF